MTQRPSKTIVASQRAWVHFAMEAAERSLAFPGGPPPEMMRFAKYMRELRYGAGISLPDLSEELVLPLEDLAMLEQGLLQPSEVSTTQWVRLMRLLGGREFLTRHVTPQEVPSDEDLWAVDEDSGGRGIQPFGVARIKVIGVGGGGSNAVNRMFRQRIEGVDYVAINTDAQHLIHLDVPEKVRIGDRLARGLGVGGDPKMGRESAEESREDLYNLLEGTDMVFIAAGMGGGTGTGAAPLVAEVAKDVGALTIAVVTKPFQFEGRRRAEQADYGVEALRGNVDTLVLIPNDRLSTLSDERLTAENAFRIADDVLRQGVQSIAELVTVPGEINLDFADVRTVMLGAGSAWMAIGYGRGPQRVHDATREAMASPLLDAPIEGATRVLLNITGGTDLTLQEVQQAADYVSRLVDPEANIIFGMVSDPKMEDEVRVTVIATGLPPEDGVIERTIEDMLEETLEDDEEPVASSEPPMEMPGILRRLFGGFSARG